ncbi:MAG: ATP-binding protein [Candidatus Omnitrophota bacterium]|nr:ATP-binding protein [Candidatus Omnitrophota bacterium]
MRIYYKLIIVFLTLSVIPVLFIGSIGFYSAKDSLEKAIISNLNNVADEGVKEIETFIAARKSDMMALQRQGVYRTAFSILDQSGSDQSMPYYMEAKKVLDVQLAVFQIPYKYVDIRLVDKLGRVIYASNPEQGLEINKYIQDKDDLFRKAKSGIYICDTCEDSGKRRLYTFCLTGLAYGAADEIIGLIQLKFDMRDMFDRLNSNTYLGESGEIICGKKTPNNETLFLSPLKHKEALISEKTISLGVKNTLAMQRAMSGENGSGINIDYRGKSVLSVWRSIKSLGWGFVAKIDESEAFLPIDKLRKLLIVTIMITIFSIILTALIIAKSIAGPIDKLRIGAHTIGSGNLDYKIGITSKNEVGQLALAFDAMAQNLKKTTASIHDLNKEIAERKRVETERERTLKWQQDVNALQQSLLAPVTLEKKLKMITDGITRIFHADFCRIWVIRPGDLCEKGCIHAEVKEGPLVCRHRDKCLHLMASSGRYTRIDGKDHARVPFDCYKIGRVASSENHKFLTNDVVNDPHIYNHKWARELELVSFAGYQLRIPNGETIGVLALFAKHPILPAEDAILDSFSTTTAFVTQQAVANNNLLRKAVELARNIEELKRSQNMLIQSEKMASLGKLVSEISHEINNPLMIISGNAQLSLMSEKLSVETKKTLELIMAECQRSKDIIRRVLRFAKPSKGEVKEVNICQVVEAIASIVEKQFKAAGVEIVRKYLESPPLVSVDEQQLQEVVMNLLNNAKDAMPDGGTITITASLESDRIRIDFKDNGFGMSEEVRKNILEPFFTTKAEGTGLGLSICYGIIKAHDGELKFESQLNKGTTATVLLPLRKALSV